MVLYFMGLKARHRFTYYADLLLLLPCVYNGQTCNYGVWGGPQKVEEGQRERGASTGFVTDGTTLRGRQTDWLQVIHGSLPKSI